MKLMEKAGQKILYKNKKSRQKDVIFCYGSYHGMGSPFSSMQLSSISKAGWLKPISKNATKATKTPKITYTPNIISLPPNSLFLSKMLV